MTGKPRTCTREGCSEKTVARRLCRAHYQAAWKAGELGAHATEPTRPRVRDRKICPPDHKHDGSSTCYIQHQCRCDPCMDLHAKMTRDRARAKAYGRFDAKFVDAGPVREHVLMLSEFGIGYKRIAKLAGFRSSTPVRTIIWGRQEPGPRYGEMQKRVKRETAEKIMRVRPSVDHLGARVLVPALGTHRRVQALVTRGWSFSKIAARIGIDPTNFSGTMKADQVHAATYRKVRDLYEELWNQPPPEETHRDRIAASRARTYAKRRHWAPPLAWDDIDTDPAPDFGDRHTDRVVDDLAIELAISGIHMKLHPDERRIAITRLHEQRLSDNQIADRLGIAAETVCRIRKELDLPAWTKAEQQAGIHEPTSGRSAA